MSKLSMDILQRCVFPFVTSNDPDVILGAAFGEDVALTRGMSHCGLVCPGGVFPNGHRGARLCNFCYDEQRL